VPPAVVRFVPCAGRSSYALLTCSTMVKSILLLLLLLDLLVPAEAWGGLFEPKKGGYHLETLLKMVEGDHDDGVVESSPTFLEESYLLNFEEQEEHVDGERLRDGLFLSEPFLWDASHFEDTALQGWEDPCGISCDEEECAIPEDYKVAAAESDIDVMDFLGIHRAEPLQVNLQGGEWE